MQSSCTSPANPIWEPLIFQISRESSLRLILGHSSNYAMEICVASYLGADIQNPSLVLCFWVSLKAFQCMFAVCKSAWLEPQKLCGFFGAFLIIGVVLTEMLSIPSWHFLWLFPPLLQAFIVGTWKKTIQSAGISFLVWIACTIHSDAWWMRNAESVYLSSSVT